MISDFGVPANVPEADFAPEHEYNENAKNNMTTDESALWTVNFIFILSVFI